MLIVDPRCDITDSDGVRVYNPRDYIKDMPPDMRKWMHKHPEWPTGRVA